MLSEQETSTDLATGGTEVRGHAATKIRGITMVSVQLPYNKTDDLCLPREEVGVLLGTDKALLLYWDGPRSRITSHL